MAKEINYWRETRSGLRSSNTIFVGTLLAAISSLLQFSSPYLEHLNFASSETLLSGFWLLWILSLWILGIAFIWVGNHPFLSQFGSVVGVFYFLQGTYLIVILYSHTEPMVPPLVFTVGRLMALFLFGLVERPSIGIPLSILIWVTSLLQLLKITLRVMNTLPEMTPLVESAVDSFFLLLVCVALIQLGRLLRTLENLWAKEKYQTRSSGFSDFNNPEHKWNE